MGILGWIIIGLLAGWVASMVMNRHHRLIVNLIIGLIGAVIGGWLNANFVHFYFYGLIGSFLVAFARIGHSSVHPWPDQPPPHLTNLHDADLSFDRRGPMSLRRFCFSETLMPTRWRKFIGSVGMLVFLGLYAVGAVMLYEHLPDLKALRLAYMVVAGIGWGVPLFPLISWMNRGR